MLSTDLGPLLCAVADRLWVTFREGSRADPGPHLLPDHCWGQVGCVQSWPEPTAGSRPLCSSHRVTSGSPCASQLSVHSASISAPPNPRHHAIVPSSGLTGPHPVPPLCVWCVSSCTRCIAGRVAARTLQPWRVRYRARAAAAFMVTLTHSTRSFPLLSPATGMHPPQFPKPACFSGSPEVTLVIQALVLEAV